MLLSSMDRNLANVLKYMDFLKNDFTCGVCSQLLKNPVTLSTCFHMVCGEHFEGLQTCPTCNAPLDQCRKFEDNGLTEAVDAFKKFDTMFDPIRPNKDNPEPSNSRTEDQTVTSSKHTPTDVKKTRRMIEQEDREEQTAEEAKVPKMGDNVRKPNVQKATSKGTEQLNASHISTASSKLNKTLEKRNTKGETTLHIACRLGKIDMVMDLLNQGANTNTKDNAGWTPLHEAVQNGHLDLVKVLLQNNALINVPGQGNETPLHEAIRYSHKDIIIELIVHGADINIRNIKGETPIQLATGDIKKVIKEAADNIIQTQTVNITHISEMQSELDFEDIRVHCVSQFRTVLGKLKILMKHHDNLHVETNFTNKVTHLVVDTEDDLTCISSLDILRAIVNELWIVSSEWVTKSSNDKLEPFTKYEVTGVGKTSHNGPKNARYNKYKLLPRLFDGCHFYLHNFTTKYEISKHTVLTKAILTKLLKDAGGTVLRRAPNPELIPEAEKLIPYHASKNSSLETCSHYIIFKDNYEPRYNMKHLKALPVFWLIECIEKYQLCEPT